MGTNKNDTVSSIMYIHHGAVPGGAPTSLLNMVKGVSSGASFQCSIYCVRREMIPFFKNNLDGVHVEKYPPTGLFSGRVFMGWSSGFSVHGFLSLAKELVCAPWYIFRETRFLRSVRPDIVHLNSSILWMSAIAAKICSIPIVWHNPGGV